MSATIDRAAYGERMFANYVALDRALGAKSFPATSPWWLRQVQRYFTHPGRQRVFRVGRRGGKSSTLCRIGVVEALYGAHVIPAGDVGTVAIVSVERRDAEDRVRTLRAILDALGIKYRDRADSLDLLHRPIQFRVFTASIAGVSGFTAICVICDEVAKWTDKAAGRNPATEVLASIRPTMATQPLAKGILSSSPLGTDDAHAKAFDVGDNDFQFVASATSWEANPTLTEAGTRADEPDEHVWLREYANRPQASAIAAIDPATLANVVRPLHPYASSLASGLVVCDSSNGSGDAWTWCPVQYVLEPCAQSEYETRERRDAEGHLLIRDEVVYDSATGREKPNPKWHPPRAVLLLHDIHGIDGAFANNVSFAEGVRRMCSTALANGMSTTIGDQNAAYQIASEALRHGVRHEQRAWTAQKKVDAAAVLRRLIRERTLVIEPGAEGERMRAELAELEERILPSGAITVVSRRTRAGHGDRASLALLASMLEAEGAIRGSPVGDRRGGFSQWDPYGSNQ